MGQAGRPCPPPLVELVETNWVRWCTSVIDEGGRRGCLVAVVFPGPFVRLTVAFLDRRGCGGWSGMSGYVTARRWSSSERSERTVETTPRADSPTPTTAG